MTCTHRDYLLFYCLKTDFWCSLDRRPPEWANEPTEEEIASAVLKGKAALKELINLEKSRKPLAHNTPAIRAQKAAATKADVKPMANNAYVVEVATKALAAG